MRPAGNDPWASGLREGPDRRCARWGSPRAVSRGHRMEPTFPRRGFLPVADRLTGFGEDSELAPLDSLGRDLPSLLQDRGFRALARTLEIPALPPGPVPLPVLRLYYIRLGFLASAY